MALYGSGTAPKTEFLINGVWTDLSTRVRGESKIVLRRGRANEQGRVTAQTAQFTLNNRDGLLSNRNPNSIYFGLLPKNTQVRFSAGTGESYMWLPWGNIALSGLVTADKAVLDVVGDIDIRAEVWPHAWRPTRDMMIASKYRLTGDQRSWALYLKSDGKLVLVWSTAGTSGTRVFATSTAPVPASSGRLGIRVTLDVNNGAAGNTATFYTASGIGGTWSALGSPIVTAGVTSIFNSSAQLVAGGGDDSQNVFGGGSGFGGRFYGLEIYNGIAGTKVADLDTTTQAVGATSWSDGLGTPNTWTVNAAPARVTSDRVRFVGEMSSLPQRWDKSGQDVYIPSTASGIIRRLTQGASPLRSAMYRNFAQYATHGYWPLEDGSTATEPANVVPGGNAGQSTNVVYGVSATLPGTSTVAQFQGSTSKLFLNARGGSGGGTASFVFYVKASAVPATTKVFATFYTNGTARRITVALDNTAWVTTFYDKDGAVLTSNGTAISGINPTQGWIGYNLLLETSGANVSYSIRWDSVTVSGGGVGPATFAGSVGRSTGMQFEASYDAAYNDLQLAQAFMSLSALNLSDENFRKASSAYLLETAIARMKRLCSEEGVSIEVTGFDAESEAMGYQTTDTFMNLIYDCADSDMGVLSELRDKLSLAYRSRVELERRSDATLNYDNSELSEVPAPVDDDQGFTNDVTVTRTGGGSSRAVVEDGATSVSDPPAGVGRYATEVTRNLGTDERTASAAGWLALTGSWDDLRYPEVAVSMHRDQVLLNASKTDQVMGLNVGDTLVLADLPFWLPPDDVPELVQGYQETLGKFLWDFVFNVTPAGPYRSVPVLGSDDFPARLDATSHTTGGALTTTATSVSLVTPAGSARWVDSATYPADFPMTLKIGGELVTLTAVTGTASPQTGTITRSVNGIVKAHNSGALVRLALPTYLGS